MPNIQYLVLIAHPNTLTSTEGQEVNLSEIDGFCPIFNDEQKAKEHAEQYNTTYIAIKEKEIEKP